MIDCLTSPLKSLLRSLRCHWFLVALDSVVFSLGSKAGETFIKLQRSVQQSIELREIPALREKRATQNRAELTDLQPETGLNRSEILAFMSVLQEATV